MNYEEYSKARINAPIVAEASRGIKGEIRKKRLQLAGLKTARLGLKAIRKLKKSLPNKLKNRRIVRGSQRATVVLNQPVYMEDKKRFFKEDWEEDDSQLYFK